MTTAVETALRAADRGDRDALAGIFQGLGAAQRVALGMELYNRRELTVMCQLIPHDFVHDVRPAGIPGMDVYRGPSGYRQFMEQWLDAFPDSHLEIEQLEERGEVVLAVVHMTTHGHTSGLPVDFRYAAVVEYSGGRLRRQWFDTDLDRARARSHELAVARGAW